MTVYGKEFESNLAFTTNLLLTKEERAEACNSPLLPPVGSQASSALKYIVSFPYLTDHLVNELFHILIQGHGSIIYLSCCAFKGQDMDWRKEQVTETNGTHFVESAMSWVIICSNSAHDFLRMILCMRISKADKIAGTQQV